MVASLGGVLSIGGVARGPALKLQDRFDALGVGEEQNTDDRAKAEVPDSSAHASWVGPEPKPESCRAGDGEADIHHESWGERGLDLRRADVAQNRPGAELRRAHVREAGVRRELREERRADEDIQRMDRQGVVRYHGRQRGRGVRVLGGGLKE